MTNTEAVVLLQKLLCRIDSDVVGTRTTEAIHVAIKALKAETRGANIQNSTSKG